MPKHITFPWRGHYDNLDAKERPIPQLGELWALPETSTYILTGFFNGGARIHLQPGEHLIGTGKYKMEAKTLNDRRYVVTKIKMMTLGGLQVWFDGSDVGNMEKVSDCQ